MRKFILFIAGIIIGFATLFAQTKDEKAIIVKTILEKEKQFEVYLLQGLVDSIDNYFSPNCHFIPEYGEIIEGRDAVSELFSSKFKSGLKIIDMKLNPVEHKVYGDIVLEVGTCIVKYISQSGSESMSKKYNYLLNWKASKKDNYRIRAATWNSVKDPCK